MTNAGFERLREAVVVQAAKDFRTAICSEKHEADAAIGKWFRSDWGDRLCYGQGNYIATNIEKEATANEKDRVHRRTYHRSA